MTPNQVKAAAAEADRKIAQLAQGGVDAPDALDGAADPSDHEGAGGGVDLAHAPDAPQPHVPTPDAEVTRAREEAALWEQRYRSLNGMIESRDRQVEQMQQLLANMQAAMQDAKPQPAAAPASTAATPQGATDADKVTFGDDLVGFVERVVGATTSSIAAALRSELDKLKDELGSVQDNVKGVAQTTAAVEQDRFLQRLTQMAPNWERVNADQKFIDWLQASKARASVFFAARDAGDVETLAGFFNDYDAATPKEPVVPAARQLEKQVAPGRSRGAAAQAAADSKKVWTRSEIAAFYDTGKKDYGADEFARLERDIFAAQREGRVDYSR